MWQGLINLILGLWLLISGLIPTFQTPANMIVVGIIVAVMGFTRVKKWPGALSGILGLWVFLSGLWFKILAPTNFIVVGLLVAGCGLWCGILYTKETAPRTP